MEIVTLIPGATTAGDDIALPAGAPDIDAVVAASIERLPTALANHGAAAIVAALIAHPAADVRDALADHAAADILGAVANHSAALLAASVADHTQTNVVNAIADHAVHAHEIEIALVAVGDTYGAVAGGTAHIVAGAVNLIPGAGATGIQNYTTPAHAVGVGPMVHGGAADLAHVAGGNPAAHGVGINPMAHAAGAAVAHVAADPAQAADPTRVNTRDFELDVDTLLGDALTLYYLGVGERVPAS